MTDVLTHRCFRIVWGFAVVCSAALGRLSSSSAAETGAQIYARLCAECHGAKGEGGTSGYAQPLAGDKSVRELADLIDRTMPEGEPEKCSSAESQAVAAYIHDAFYSPIAQARNQPPRIELSRLTVKQYRNTLADLIGSFRWNNNFGTERGLKASYYSSRRTDKKNLALERVDPQVKFNFGDKSADPAKIKPEEFAIQWIGALRAPETGEYEFVVRTENGARFYVNKQWSNPVIDAGVRSGDDREFRGSIFLLGGRVYPIRLEYFKSKQSNEKTASIELLWKQPRHALETIPARVFTTNPFPELFLVNTPFPPDDRSLGYERGASISKAWELATTDGALETADYVNKHLNELAKTKDDDKEQTKKVREFCYAFAERAFRRPLTSEQKQLYVDRHFAAGRDLSTAVTRTVLSVLKSPRFLYREIEGSPGDQFNIASRLAYDLWDSMPDRQLTEAATKGWLKNPLDIRKQADRMCWDMRTQAKLSDFLQQWLKVDQLAEISKDSKLYPGFDAATVSDLRTSLDMFLDDLVTSDGADYRRLLTDDTLYLNGRLAKYYGAKLPPDADFQPVKFEPEARSGVISHPYILASLAYTGTSSPIHRGVFLSRSVLGRALRPPPEAVAPLAPDLHASLTTRERVVVQTSAKACQSCHSMINALGFTLENFDAVGRYRAQEKGKPVDAAGSYITRGGDAVKFRGADELAKFLVSSEETHAAFVEQLFHSFVKQPVLAYGPDTLANLEKSFTANQFNMRRLLVDIAVAAATGGRSQPTQNQVTSSR